MTIRPIDIQFYKILFFNVAQSYDYKVKIGIIVIEFMIKNIIFLTI